MRTDLSDSFGLDLALFAFNYQPDVVIEVCKNGGLGVLGAVRFTPAELREALDYIEANIGGRPYGVDVVMPAKTEAKAGMDVASMHDMLQEMIPQEHKDFVESVLDKFEVPQLPEGAETGRDLLSWNDTEAREQVAISLERPDVKLIVNALGAAPEGRRRPRAPGGCQGRRPDRPQGPRPQAGRQRRGHHRRPGHRGRWPQR